MEPEALCFYVVRPCVRAYMRARGQSHSPTCFPSPFVFFLRIVESASTFLGHLVASNRFICPQKVGQQTHDHNSRAYSKRVPALIVHSDLKNVHSGFPVAFIFEAQVN